MGKIFFVMGKSSSGKDTIYKELLKDEKLKLKTIVPYTTRPMREGETDGKEYFFVSEDTMKQMDAEGNIIELRSYDTIYGIWNYFTANDGQVDLDSNSYIMIGTLESYSKIKAFYGEDNVFPIYINVNNGERLRRAMAREEKEKVPKYDEMCRRFLADEKDFSDEKIKENEITKFYENNDLLICINEIKNDIILNVN